MKKTRPSSSFSPCGRRWRRRPPVAVLQQDADALHRLWRRMRGCPRRRRSRRQPLTRLRFAKPPPPHRRGGRRAVPPQERGEEVRRSHSKKGPGRNRGPIDGDEKASRLLVGALLERGAENVA